MTVDEMRARMSNAEFLEHRAFYMRVNATRSVR